MPNSDKVPGSFRDPSGFLYVRDGVLYRQINVPYQADYTRLMDSGLYESLVKAGLLIPHEETAVEMAAADGAFKVIRPEPIDFISYPYEWCFTQLKTAALATLTIQKKALDAGMSLKDASAYNIQFHHGKPTLIDTLSFETYKTGAPWVAYQQFCQHFLAPLALMSYTDVRLTALSRIHIDGIPIDLASTLLPARSKLRLSLLFHIHLLAKSQKRYAAKPEAAKTVKRQFSENAMRGLIDSLESGIARLRWKPQGTEWGDYYDATNYTGDAQKRKAELVGAFLDEAQPRTVWDVGANTGLFSRIAAERALPTVAFDIDPAAVEKNFQAVQSKGERHILPLIMDLTNPSPGIGWHHQERMSLLQRGPADTVLALALVHHLAISNNLPFTQIAQFFAQAGRWLIIEFVPKNDSQVQRMLASREDIFHEYDITHFERTFSAAFTIHKRQAIEQSERTLFLMERKD